MSYSIDLQDRQMITVHQYNSINTRKFHDSLLNKQRQTDVREHKKKIGNATSSMGALLLI
jgi:hypothetical protein